jgi:UDP-N-acetylglucosamine--N-acetylmuramyl-(pentapeptide) pyrophosphoryl-undecaprenol N-acetylglucosamine transferase
VADTIVVAGGGTGGHLYPGISIAQEIETRRPGVTIVFAGAGTSLERTILAPHGYRLIAIRSGGVVGKSLAGRVRGIGRAMAGFAQSIRTLMRRRPRVVIGVGGYASGPLVLAAVMLRVPSLIHEQNYYPGLTNRLLAPWVRRVAVSFEETRRYFGGRGVVTGNPIRAAFRGAKRKTRGDTFNVLIFGGSQGAKAINTTVVDALPRLREHRAGLRFLHGTGAADHGRVAAAYAASGLEAQALPYITDILRAYEWADLVVARAGASSVSEIAVCGKASILVPLPTAAHDHQRYNARKFEEAGASLVLEESSLTGETLAQTLLQLRADPERVTAMERSALLLARPDAASRIVDLVAEMLSW